MTMPGSVASASFDFSHHGGFQQQFNWPGAVTALNSAVFASISEITDIGGQVTPFQGAATLSIDNVVPGNGNIIVRGNIGWDSDITVRIFVFAVPIGL
jgi:hypothetical protein